MQWHYLLWSNRTVAVNILHTFDRYLICKMWNTRIGSLFLLIYLMTVKVSLLNKTTKCCLTTCNLMSCWVVGNSVRHISWISVMKMLINFIIFVESSAVFLFYFKSCLLKIQKLINSLHKFEEQHERIGKSLRKTNMSHYESSFNSVRSGKTFFELTNSSGKSSSP